MSNDAEWNDLLGRQVEIQWAGRTVRIGLVEAVTASADALWLAAHGVDARALNEKSQGYMVLPVHDERTRPACKNQG